MSQREANTFKRLRERLTRPEDRFERVENGIGAGMPDVNYCFAGAEGWIELKAPLEPARESTQLLGCSGNHPLSIDQVNWFIVQHRAAGRVHLFVATRRRLLLIPAQQVIRLSLEINKLSASQLERITSWKATVPVMDQAVWFSLRSKLVAPVPLPNQRRQQG